MKSILLPAGLLFAAVPAFSQTNTFPSSGSAGVGTLSPGSKMEIAHSAPYTLYLSGNAPSLYWGGTSGVFPNSSANTATAFIGFSTFAGSYAQGAGDLNIGTQSFASGNSSGINFLVPTDDAGAYNTTPAMRITRTGNVGIGNSAPLGLLSIGNAAVSGSDGHIVIGKNNAGTRQMRIGYDSNFDFVIGDYGYSNVAGTWTKQFAIHYQAPANSLYINTAGNVGVGTNNPTHKLNVNGTIRAKEVIVDTGWADYVFEKDYRLAPLVEVEAHIEQNGRLPGIPSAAEIAENGVSMGEVQAKMMAKIEELTLHLIAQEKRIQQLEADNAKSGPVHK